MDIIWWIKLFILYVALMFFSLIVFVLSLPLWLFLRRLAPHPIINGIRRIFWEIMKWIFPIGITIAVVLYFVWLILRYPLLGITLGIVDLSDYTPFKELIYTGVFDWVEALLTLNPVGIYHASWKIMQNTPRFAQELFGGEIRKVQETSQTASDTLEEEVTTSRVAKYSEYDNCVDNQSIQLTPNMSDEEKEKARQENEKIGENCRKQHIDT